MFLLGWGRRIVLPDRAGPAPSVRYEGNDSSVVNKSYHPRLVGRRPVAHSLSGSIPLSVMKAALTTRR